MTNTPGGRLRKLREGQGLTQQTLAERAGLSVSFLSEIENGRRNPSGRVLLSLASALGTTIDFLLRGIEPPRREKARGPMVVPPELAAAAERAGLSLKTVRALQDAYSQVVASRGAEPEREPTADDWLAMYRALQRFME